MRLRVKSCLLLLSAAGLFSGCSRIRTPQEIAYVSAPQAFLRDQVAAIYNKTGTVKNGEVVQILGRDRRFARVRTSTGVEGWLEQRYLVTKQTYDAFQKLREAIAVEARQQREASARRTSQSRDRRKRRTIGARPAHDGRLVAHSR